MGLYRLNESGAPIPCNLPELQNEQAVMWIYEKLLVGATDEEASEHFKRELEISLNTRGTSLSIELSYYHYHFLNLNSLYFRYLHFRRS